MQAPKNCFYAHLTLHKNTVMALQNSCTTFLKLTAVKQEYTIYWWFQESEVN
jgi:hypothetical protein